MGTTPNYVNIYDYAYKYYWLGYSHSFLDNSTTSPDYRYPDLDYMVEVAFNSRTEAQKSFDAYRYASMIIFENSYYDPYARASTIRDVLGFSRSRYGDYDPSGKLMNSELSEVAGKSRRKRKPQATLGNSIARKRGNRQETMGIV
jgi:hypothetical protein